MDMTALHLQAGPALGKAQRSFINNAAVSQTQGLQNLLQQLVPTPQHKVLPL